MDIRNITATDSTIGPECKVLDGALNGTCRTFWPNGGIKSEGVYKDNLIAGNFKAWYQNGVLAEEWSLDPDNKDGLKTLYWPNGNMELQTFYENGAVREQKHWNENGSFSLHQLTMDSTTVLVTSYFGNGQIAYSGTLLNGNRTGQWRFYNSKGELCGIGLYLNGERIEGITDCP